MSIASKLITRTLLITAYTSVFLIFYYLYHSPEVLRILLFKKTNQKDISITCESHMEVNHDSDPGASSKPLNILLNAVLIPPSQMSFKV